LRDRIARVRSRTPGLTFVACAASVLLAAPALAEASTDSGGAPIDGGGMSAPGRPVVERVVCKTSCLGRRKATPGAVIKVKGEFLDYAQQVVFRGTSGPMPVSLTYHDPIRVRAIIPEGAISSRPYVLDSRGRRSNRAPRKLRIRSAPAISPAVFPVLGPHDYGGAGARFGAPRNGHTHQGQDVIAACGTPLVSAMAGTVQYAGYQSAAGNYIVIDNNGTADDFVYMHLAKPAYVAAGGAVGAGQQIGVVGETGDATGCHLHFEYWQGDWYGGGHPIDPLPYLLAWDNAS
jgi:murein DD-endopeptidase MepM/ murein hydrolase activator NlpD